MTTDHNEAMRLAEWLKARQSHLGSSRESCWDGEQRCWDNYDQAAAILRKQAERIAELEARVHTCGPTCSKAGCINRRLTAERDTLRAEVERLREFFDADRLVSKIMDEVSPGLTSPKGADYAARVDAAINRRCAAVAAIDTARKATL